MQPANRLLVPLLGLLCACAITTQAQQPRFRQIARFKVDGKAEIVCAGSDGDVLLYTNSAKQAIDVVDLRDPHAPAAYARLGVDGEPTSVAARGRWAVAVVYRDKPRNGAKPPAFGAGHLVVIDLLDPARPRLVGRCDIGYHPDSVALTEIDSTLVAVVAIENEPVVVKRGRVKGSDAPGDRDDVSPPGSIQVISIDTLRPAASRVRTLALPAPRLEAAGLHYPDDPQPEYVAIHGTRAAVTLQEQNGVCLVDISDPARPVLTKVFSLGIAHTRLTDLTADGVSRFDERYPDDVYAPRKKPDAGRDGRLVPPGTRFPDAIAFSPDGNAILTADEGELGFTGGRGWSIWSPQGWLLADDGGTLERESLRLGLYPESRSESKGIEVEGVTAARFGNTSLAFLLSERGSFMGVYDIGDARAPRLLQVLPTGLSPEGVVAIPGRGLVVTADEVSGTLTVFQLARDAGR